MMQKWTKRMKKKTIDLQTNFRQSEIRKEHSSSDRLIAQTKIRERGPVMHTKSIICCKDLIRLDFLRETVFQEVLKTQRSPYRVSKRTQVDTERIQTRLICPILPTDNTISPMK